MVLDERGVFWRSVQLPAFHFAPETATHGRLTIDDDGLIQLDLDGILHPSLEHPISHVLKGYEELDPSVTISGILKGSGRHVLLFYSRRNGATANSNNISFENFRFGRCLISSSPISRCNVWPKFRKIRVSLLTLRDWVQARPITISEGRSVFTAKYKAPKELVYTVDGGRLRIRSSFSRPYAGGGTSQRSEVTISHHSTLEIIFLGPRGVEDIVKNHRHIEDLMMLLSNEDVKLEWPTTKLVGYKNEAILYFNRNPRKNSEFDRASSWTTLPQISSRFGDIYNCWMQKRDVFGSGFYLYFGTQRNKSLYTENQFASFVWGLESFHRVISGERPDEGLVSKIERIKSALQLSKEDLRWINGLLKRASEPNLEKRLFEVFCPLQIGVKSVDLKRFCQLCAKARNELSHYGGNRPNTTTYDEFSERLALLSRALALLYHARILQELSVPSEEVGAVFISGLSSHRYQWILHAAGLLDSAPPGFKGRTLLRSNNI